MLLAVDIGNTNITLGVFEGEEIKARWRIATDVHKQTDEYAVILYGLFSVRDIRPTEITDAIISSVAPPLTSVFQDFCQHYLDLTPLVLGAGVKTGIRILYDNPKEVGADRVADAVAAFKKYGGPAIVVDFGTATVFDAVSREGDYLGGAIAPGINIAAEALFEKASKLPRIELIPPPRVIGRNTEGSMQSGLIFGYLGLVEGLVARFQKELGGNAKVIATGGLAATMAKHTKVLETVNQDLTLEGLRIIYDLNRP